MPDTITLTVEPSSSLQAAADSFIQAIGAWTKRVIAAYPEGFISDSHDGGTFMIPWAPYIKATGDERPLAFMQKYRDEAKRHFEETDQWLDGYWRRQEVHHGTEHFDLFLRELWYLQPDDCETVHQLEDAAEHAGNWKPGFPEWFDWESGLFRSLYLGTEFVGEFSRNIPDSVRVARVSMLAYEMTGKERYLNLVCNHIETWVQSLIENEILPVGIDEEGGVFDLDEDGQAFYNQYVGAAPPDFNEQLTRTENLIASEMPDLLLELWRKLGENRYKRAAEKIIDQAVAELNSPVAWQVQAAVRRYRKITGSTRYDKPVRNVPQNNLRPIDQLNIVPEVESHQVTGPLGMRIDKPDWLDQNGNAAPSPLLWALQAVVTGDEQLMTQAVDLGLAYFRLAEKAYGDVTHHGCGSRSLAAVSRGHGRLNGAGVVTEVLSPAIEYTW